MDEHDAGADTAAANTAVAILGADERQAYIRLALVSGVGPQTMSALLDYFQSPVEVLKARLSQLQQVPRVGERISMSIRDANNDELADKVHQHCLDHEVRMLLPNDDEFPELLKEIPGAPLLLFVRGSFSAADKLSIGIVGTRHATHYGRTVTEAMARSLARAKLTIVSGLARGIDAFAHKAALEVGGRTVAFLGSSVTDIYPSEHTDLADQIASNGVLVSETHPFMKPKAGVFPQRNRLISGLSLGVIIVEAAERSGALITASHAGEQGRDVFAVPGPVNSRMSRGCNRLIRDGAILVQDADDVIDHLGPLYSAAEISADRTVRFPAELQLNEIEAQVLQFIDATPTDLDVIIARSGMSPARIMSTCSVLEMQSLIVRIGGRCFQRR